jgi:Protein of unknown function (DUF1570)
LQAVQGRRTIPAMPAGRLLLVVFLCIWTAPVHAQLKKYDTPYYIIYTDIDADSEKEADVRMTRMADEYHQRTKDFSGQITQKFPFYLYRSSADYYAAGGLPGTTGVFGGSETNPQLMAIAGQKTTLSTWHTVQHEGFHQFAHAVIGGMMPPWMDEGLAEYFGESLFTGDGFVTGLVPPWRLARLQHSLVTGKLKSIQQIMLITPDEWRTEMNIANYDQAWSMVHFLVHGENGKYQPAFAACIREISHGKTFEQAWLDNFGSVDGFEQKWKAYWLAQSASPTSDLYVRAVLETLTSFLARATAEDQIFTSFDDFSAAAHDGKLKMSAEDWLPPSLLKESIGVADQYSAWELHPDSDNQPTLSVMTKEGTKMKGIFVLNGGRVKGVYVK